MDDMFEIIEVSKVIKRYIDATRNADIPALKEIFHKNAVMNGFLEKNAISDTPEPFFDDLLSRPSMAEMKDNYKAEICSLNVIGNIANAVILETGFFDKITIENHLHLFKENGSWKVTSKLFTSIP